MSCHDCVKILLFVVNLIFSLIGLGIFVLGILGIVYVNQVKDLVSDLDLPNYVAPAIMVVGIVIFFISFSGCCGAIKEIDCLLILYIILMLLLAVAKIGGAVYIFMNKGAVENNVKTLVNDVVITSDAKSPTMISLHGLEYLAKCCGTDGPSSYENAHAKIPISCCPVSSQSCDISSEDLYDKGCKELAPEKIASYLNIATYSLIGVAVFEVVSMIAAIYLSTSRRKGNGYYEYD